MILKTLATISTLISSCFLGEYGEYDHYPLRNTELANSIFTGSMSSFACSLTDAGNLPAKMALLNLCFKEIFLGKVARLVLRRCLRGNGTTLNGVEKNHPDLFGMTDDGMVTFFVGVVWLSQVAQGPSVPPPPSVPEVWMAQGRLPPAHKLMRICCLLTVDLSWMAMFWSDLGAPHRISVFFGGLAS